MKPNELLKSLEIFKIQGIKTPEETFVLGYIMAHGGEQYILSLMEHDLKLLEHNTKFWLPHVKDAYNIWKKVSEEDVANAHKLLKSLLEARKAKIPAWLKTK